MLYQSHKPQNVDGIQSGPKVRSPVIKTGTKFVVPLLLYDLKNVLNEILHIQCKTHNDVITFYKLTGISKPFCVQKI